MKYGLTFASRKVRELRQWVGWRLGVAYFATRGYSLRRFGELKPFGFSVLSTFLAEAAVLILVFPPLEFFLARRNAVENPKLVTGAPPIDIVPVMEWSGILCFGLLAVSILFKEIASRAGADEGEN